MEEQRILEELKIVPLLTKIVRGEELTVLEEKTVEVWLSRSSSNKAFFEQLKDKEHVAMELLNRDAASSTTADELQKLHSLIDKNRPTPLWRYWLTAAAIIFTISVSVFLYRYFQSGSIIQNDIVTVSTVKDIEPGKEQATLSFEDGQVIDLEGKTIKSDANGVTYVDGKAVSESTVQYATLSTPRKGQYKTILPDGTEVWLNAESKLKYPTQFNNDRRLVELEGEGYFEVVHNASKPFIVVSKNQCVKVLGTRFNINSYANEPTILTTLVSGSVELTNTQTNTPILLKPGQQSKLLESGFDVYPVDTENFTAWTSNEFQFKGSPLKEVLRQLERWYDLDVDYTDIPDTKVYGTISREKKLSSVLYALEKITDVQFKVTGRRIQIKK
ncbi:FecR family protein [Chryseobacterium scophthalmum]|uniref:FecR family protein n=1 Tax=Chryseobacterium scophthalmum TaxID=59733 RepID=UPI003CFD4F6A